MRIDGNSGWTPASATRGSPVSESRSVETSRIMNDVDTARRVALSALHNERFSAALEKLSDPRSSDALMLMGRDDGANADHKSVMSAYADNSE
ncbi:MAG: hypothetical protein J0I86_16625 [Mesorhizobium sp.]|nr:hypothetical protein [Mesorhizobium sp.]